MSSNLDEWISEFPSQRSYILNRRSWFDANPVPRDRKKEMSWKATLESLGLEDDTEKSIGSE